MATPNDDVRTWFPRAAAKQLGAWDFVKGDVTLEIIKVEQGLCVGEKGRKEILPMFYLKGKKGPIDRPLVLNKTNLRTFKQIYGTTKASEMIGKRITLYATTCQFGRDTASTRGPARSR